MEKRFVTQLAKEDKELQLSFLSFLANWVTNLDQQSSGATLISLVIEAVTFVHWFSNLSTLKTV